MMQVLNSFIFYSLIFACFISYSPVFLYFFCFCMCASIYVYIYLAVPLLPWFSWNLSIKRPLILLCVCMHVCVYICMHIRVCVPPYINVYLYLHMYQGFSVGTYSCWYKPLAGGHKFTHMTVIYTFIKLPLLWLYLSI